MEDMDNLISQLDGPKHMLNPKSQPWLALKYWESFLETIKAPYHSKGISLH